jgi:hypothetical protein
VETQSGTRQLRPARSASQAGLHPVGDSPASEGLPVRARTPVIRRRGRSRRHLRSDNRRHAAAARKLEVESDLIAAFGGSLRKWQARFSACHFPGRPNPRPSGETTGRRDVHRYGNAACLSTVVASRSASLLRLCRRRPSFRAKPSCCSSPCAPTRVWTRWRLSTFRSQFRVIPDGCKFPLR